MLKWICAFLLAFQSLCAAHGNNRANMDREQERYEDDKPTLYDLNQGEFEDDSPNWDRSYTDHNGHEEGSCQSGSCKKPHRLHIEDD